MPDENPLTATSDDILDWLESTCFEVKVYFNENLAYGGKAVTLTYIDSGGNLKTISGYSISHMVDDIRLGRL